MAWDEYTATNNSVSKPRTNFSTNMWLPNICTSKIQWQWQELNGEEKFTIMFGELRIEKAL